MNINKLRGKITEKEMTVEKLAKTMNIAKSTLYRKFNAGGRTITIGEVGQIVDVLQLSEEEAKDIFLPRKSHDVQKHSPENLSRRQ